MDNFPPGTRVSYWNAAGDTVYGTVQRAYRTPDGSTIVSLKRDGSGMLIELPALSLTKMVSRSQQPSQDVRGSDLHSGEWTVSADDSVIRMDERLLRGNHYYPAFEVESARTDTSVEFEPASDSDGNFPEESSPAISTFVIFTPGDIYTQRNRPLFEVRTGRH
ncbi:hypothetical protein C8R43DRAFT_452243 [Mycena crocata]|nr:hypothetical protein C8R43DRAFT_452243 [Mycena crocata]